MLSLQRFRFKVLWRWLTDKQLQYMAELKKYTYECPKEISDAGAILSSAHDKFSVTSKHKI